VIMTEGMGVSLDPDFQLEEVLSPYAQRLVTNRYSFASLRRHLSDAGVDAFEIATPLPIQLRRLQTLLDEGGPEVHLRTADLEPLVDRLDVISKRVVFGVVTAAALRGVVEIITADPEHRAWQVPLLSAGVGTAGVIAAFVGVSSRGKKQPTTGFVRPGLQRVAVGSIRAWGRGRAGRTPSTPPPG
jgi:ubiquinone biosynthesis protein